MVEDADSKRYKIAILQMRYEGQLLWQRFGAFFLLHGVFLAFLLGKAADGILSNMKIFVMSLVGFVLCILWFAVYQRSYAYYKLRIAQAREVEPWGWQLLAGRGERFSKGERVDIYPYRMPWPARRVRTEYSGTFLILLVSFIYFVLVVVSYPWRGGNPMEANDLYYAFSTIAQVAAALAALIGFLGLWRLDRLREERNRIERLFQMMVGGILPDTLVRYGYEYYVQEIRRQVSTQQVGEEGQTPPSTLASALTRWDALPGEMQRLIDVLVAFLLGTLTVLVIAILLLGFVDTLRHHAWLMRGFIGIAGLWLGIAPAYVVLQAAGGVSTLDQLRAYPSHLIQHTWRGLLTLVQAVRPGSASRRSSHAKSKR